MPIKLHVKSLSHITSLSAIRCFRCGAGDVSTAAIGQASLTPTILMFIAYYLRLTPPVAMPGDFAGGAVAV